MNRTKWKHITNKISRVIVTLLLYTTLYGQSEIPKKMSIQGFFPDNFQLKDYFVPAENIQEAVIFQGPFYDIEAAKLTNNFSDIDTFDAVNPNAFRILYAIKSDYNCFGYSRYGYHDFFFKTLLGSSYSKENIDSLIDEGKVPLTAIQAAFINFYKDPENKRKSFWYDSEIAQGMDIVFLDVFHEDRHFDDNDYIFNDDENFKHIIFVKSREINKEFKKIRKEFKLSRKSLNKKTTEVQLDKGGSIQLIIW